jgi:hypothetical protein
MNPGSLARRGRGRAHPLHGRRLLPPPPAEGAILSVHDAELPRLRARDAVAGRRRHEAHPLRDGARAARADLHAQHRGHPRARRVRRTSGLVQDSTCTATPQTPPRPS